MSNHPLLLTAAETAAILRVSRSTLYEMIANGEIDSIKLRGSRRFRPDAIDAAIARAEAREDVGAA